MLNLLKKNNIPIPKMKKGFSTSLTKEKKVPWLYLFGSVMSFNAVNFGIAKYLDDFSIVDIAWGPMFIIPNAYLLIKRWKHRNPTMLLTFGLVSIWGSRLAYHIGSRHTHGEDYRYTTMRKRWEHMGFVSANLYSFLWVFGMQGFFSMIVNASALHIMQNSVKT